MNAIHSGTTKHFPITKQQGQKEIRREEGSYLQEGVQWKIEEKIFSSDAEEHTTFCRCLSRKIEVITEWGIAEEVTAGKASIS